MHRWSFWPSVTGHDGCSPLTGGTSTWSAPSTAAVSPCSPRVEECLRGVVGLRWHHHVRWRRPSELTAGAAAGGDAPGGADQPTADGGALGLVEAVVEAA